MTYGIRPRSIWLAVSVWRYGTSMLAYLGVPLYCSRKWLELMCLKRAYRAYLHDNWVCLCIDLFQESRYEGAVGEVLDLVEDRMSRQQGHVK